MPRRGALDDSRTNTDVVVDRQSKRLRVAYAFLVAANLITAGLAIYLCDTAMSLMENFVAENREWATRKNILADAGAAAFAINGPANDVFQTNDVPRERARRDAALKIFDSRAEQLRAIFIDDATDSLNSKVSVEIDRFEATVNLMIALSDQVFTRIEAGELARASEVMAEMDRAMRDAAAVLTEIGDDLRDAQDTSFASQLRRAHRDRTLVNGFIALVALIIFGALLYGRKLNATLGLAEEERRRHIALLEASEAQLRDANDGLERAVGERTEALTLTNNTLKREIGVRAAAEERLREALALAQAANDAKRSFLANMSHELRTPLNAVIGFSEMLQMTGETLGSERRQEYVDHIHTAGRHLLTIISDLLDMQNIETGTIELNAQVFSPAAFVAETVSLVEADAREAGVALSTSVPPTLPHLNADEARMRQILLNLLSNAIKFTPKNGAIAVSASVAASGEFLLRVSDTGIGMSREQLASVLEPFRTGEDAYARQYQGAGLGLSIVAGLVKLHGGALDVDSEPGLGTTVTVRFPALRLVRLAEAKPDRSQAESPENVVTFGQGRKSGGGGSAA